MRCQHVYFFNRRTRCDSPATHWLRDDRGKRVAGVWCESHAREIVTEYREKAGWTWTMEPIEEEL